MTLVAELGYFDKLEDAQFKQARFGLFTCMAERNPQYEQLRTIKKTQFTKIKRFKLKKLIATRAGKKIKERDQFVH